MENRSRHAWPTEVGWADASRVKGCGEESVREYRGFEVRERFWVVEECKGSTVTVERLLYRRVLINLASSRD